MHAGLLVSLPFSLSVVLNTRSVLSAVEFSRFCCTGENFFPVIVPDQNLYIRREKVPSKQVKTIWRNNLVVINGLTSFILTVFRFQLFRELWSRQ